MLPVIRDGEIPPPGALVQNGWRPLLWQHQEHGERAFEISSASVSEAVQQVQLLHADGWRAVKWEHPSLGRASVINGTWVSGLIGAALSSSDVFQKLFQKRAAARPVNTKRPHNTERPWDIPLGPIEGRAGESKVLEAWLCAEFRAEKLRIGGEAGTFASSSPSSEPLVEIIALRLDGREMMLPSGLDFRDGLSLVSFCVMNASKIELEVRFLVDAVFYANIFGTVTV